MSLPLWVLIALAIRMTSAGPIFFRQLRIGYCDGQQTHLFYMIKFRTMVHDAERLTGTVWSGKNDPRITKLGRFLRKSRLDELPQMINVCRGDMSLVGPRPERPELCHNIEQEIPYFSERTCYVRPGITGLAQVYLGYDTCIDDVRKKVMYDHSYALALHTTRSWLKMDCCVLVRTVYIMLAGRGQ
jgi:lipopolysaccharide/colanic/teichoic acid biosynthesis glycosyltransferase